MFLLMVQLVLSPLKPKVPFVNFLDLCIHLGSPDLLVMRFKAYYIYPIYESQSWFDPR